MKLGHNNLEEVPNYFGKEQSLPHLRKLLLGHNKISSVSQEFFSNFPKLEVLDLSYNKLREIDPLIKNFKNLKKLYLVGNLFTKIPISISKLSLEKLYLEWSFYESLNLTLEDDSI